MSRLLEEALEKVGALPPDEQEAIAAQILASLADEAAWKKRLADKRDVILRVARDGEKCWAIVAARTELAFDADRGTLSNTDHGGDKTGSPPRPCASALWKYKRGGSPLRFPESKR